MNGDQNVDPMIDLGLALGNSHHRTRRRLNNEPGAGANAGSGVEPYFIASNPLSELVWYTEKGLSLKLADYSSTDQNRAVLCDVGPGNAAPTPPKLTASLRSCSKRSHGNNFETSMFPFDKRCDSGERRDTSAQLPSLSHALRKGKSDGLDEDNTVIRANQGQRLKDNEEEEICSPLTPHVVVIKACDTRENNLSSLQDILITQAAKFDSSHGQPIFRDDEVAGRNQTLNVETRLPVERNSVDLCDVYGPSTCNIVAQGTRLSESSSATKNIQYDKLKRTFFPPIHPSEKWESTAENDVPTLNFPYGGGAEVKSVASELAGDVQNNLHMEENFLKAIAPSQNSHSCSKVKENERKGKGKALFERNMLTKDDKSHDSAESCNSGGQFLIGKKRRSFDHQLVLGSKRVKTNSQATPDSCTKQNSSFLNWISNIRKGLNSNQGKAPSVALSLGQSSHEPSHDTKLVTCNKKQDPESRSTGFRSIFESMYSSGRKFQENRVSNEECEAEEKSNELELANETCNTDAILMACGDGNLCNESTSKSRRDPVAQLKILPLRTAAPQQENKTNSMESKTSASLAAERESEVPSHLSCGKSKVKSVASNELRMPTQFKTTQYRVEPTTSLWITRFMPVNSSTLQSRDHCAASNQNDIHYSKMRNLAAIRERFREDGLAANKELQNFAGDTDSICFDMNDGHKYDQNHRMELSPKRLESFKHVIPTGVAKDAACATLTCFFCGIQGHHLQTCRQITDVELQDLLKNMSSCSINRMELDGRRRTENQKLLHCQQCDVMRNNSKTKVNNSDSVSNDEVEKSVASCSGENKSKEDHNACLYSSVNGDASDLPRALFDSVKRLRFSRIDILKLKNSSVSLSCLGGFYLRLRLGKWEKGLGGTEYYVACVTGVQGDGSSGDRKRSISVSVGGIQCLVESQYISNHDFSENELLAWWSMISKDGSSIPSEEELRRKEEEKKMLGF